MRVQLVQPRISSIHGKYLPTRRTSDDPSSTTSLLRYYSSSSNAFYHCDNDNSNKKRLEKPFKGNCRSYSSSIPSSLSSSSLTRNSDDDGSLVVTSKDGVVGKPIDFDVNSKIEGNESQIVTITLEPNQVLRAESGAMMYMVS